VVRGPTELRGGEVDSRGDHRVALAFAVAGLLTAERVRIRQWSCIDTSFPDFLDVLSGVRKSR
jgi:3-phosphoshikimate 1-carboxyvinyltransferase